MRMRRAALWAGVIGVAAALAALGSAPWPLSAEAVAKSLNAAFGAGRLRWSAPKAATFRALPWPSLTIMDAQLDDASGASLVLAPEARLDLSVGELVRGRFSPVRAVLVTPIMTVDLDRSSVAGQRAIGRPAAGSGASAPLGGFSLTNGVLRILSRSRGLDTVVENVQGRVDGFAAGDRIRVNLSALWREAPISFSGSLADPEQAERGEPSPFELAVVSPIADLMFEGALATGGSPSLAGAVSVTIPSLRALARVLGPDRPAFLAADDVTIAAKL